LLIWRGWGLAVFYALIFWILAAMVAAVSLAGDAVTDHQSVNRYLDLGVALVLALTAATVFCVGHYRKTHPKCAADLVTGQPIVVEHLDDFYYLSLKTWSAVFLVGAIIFVGMSFFGVSLA
jgi:hypothetical protein